jgi:hypothetical protein
MPKALVDPYSGQAYRIAHQGDQFAVYSIGPNREDEHGAYNMRKWPTGGTDDVVARTWDVSSRGLSSSADDEGEP